MSAPEAALEGASLGIPPFLLSPLLTSAGIRHAFFTRAGGVSQPPYGSLNLSLSVGDEPDAVLENRRLTARALEVAPERVFRASQVHGCGVVVVDGPEANTETASRPGDAVVTASAGAACAVITADCVPILVASRRTPHVAAIHSGWRGFVAGIIPRAFDALRAAGADDFVVAVGPHISVDAFEVSDEVAEQLGALATGIVQQGKQKPHVDLRRLAHAQLRAAGVSADCVDDVLGCTYLEPTRFFSYRRDGAKSGRQLAAIVAPSPM